MSVEGFDGTFTLGTTAPGTLALQKMSHVARNTPSLQTRTRPKSIIHTKCAPKLGNTTFNGKLMK